MHPIENIISQLEKQRAAIDSAIAALTKIAASGGTVPKKAPGKRAAAKATGRTLPKRRLSEEGRRNIIEATKRRWAAVRAAKGEE